MADSTCESEDRLYTIRNKVAAISWCATHHYPTPVTGENWSVDWAKQQRVVEALDQAQLAWDLATTIIAPQVPDLSVSGRLTSELSSTVNNFIRRDCMFPQFPARGENPEVDTLLI
jgi:hypothetical protein